MVKEKGITKISLEKKIHALAILIKKEGIEISRIILFGSWAKNKHNKYSDIDLCIVTPFKRIDLIKANQKLLSLSWQIDSRIEPILYKDSDFKKDEDPLLWQIKHTGKEIRF